MANLYEIDQGILECIDFETGEVIDPDRLEELQMERSQKIENVVLWIKNLESDALAIKAEKDALADREAKCKKKAEQLKTWLGKALEGQKFSTSKCEVGFRRSEKVEITDEYLIPGKFMVATTTYKPDKTAIKEAIKHGDEISGCRLVENQNIQIK